MEDALERALEQFPLCYGYWLQYAEVDPSRRREILERGLSRNPYCVELWVALCASVEDDSERLGILERATRQLRLVPRSLEVWARRLEAVSNEERPNVVRELVWPHPELDWVSGELEGVDLHLVKEAWARRAPYEAAIASRDYYHPQPLAEAQLEAWRSYVDFEENDGDDERIRVLYERCLVPCFDYPEFWMRYGLWLAATRGPGVAAKVLDDRAPSTPDLEGLRADLLEADGQLDEARRIHLRMSSGLLEARLRAANFERRTSNVHDALALLEGDADLAGHLSAFHGCVVADLSAARATLQAALQTHPNNDLIWRAYYHLEATNFKDPYNHNRMQQIPAHAPFPLLRRENDDFVSNLAANTNPSSSSSSA